MFSNVRRCCLVSIDPELLETRELCRTLGLELSRELIQRREAPDPISFIGKGKLDELKELLDGIDLVIFNGELTPSQHFRLETALRRPCTDRIGLILEIYNRHASSPEARDQVTLARIRYELPFLREWVSKSLSDDRPGFLAGGEYAIDAYYENARKQMMRIEKSIGRFAAERDRRRQRRRGLGFFLVSICGYTNSGKSTLLNTLSGSDVQVDDMMFSTLSTTTRRLLDRKKRILMTDTVGLIRNLPPELIDAFNATMEEIYSSDCVVLVVDLSDPLDILLEKLHTSLKILVPKVTHEKILIALNKVDALENEQLQRRINSLQQQLQGYSWYLISAKDTVGIDELIEDIVELSGMNLTTTVIVENDEKGADLVRWLSERFVVLAVEWTEKVTLTLQVTEEELDMIQSKAAKYDSVLIRTSPARST